MHAALYVFNMSSCIYIQYNAVCFTLYLCSVVGQIYCVGLQTLTVGVGKLTGGWAITVYHTVIHIVVTLSVRT